MTESSLRALLKRIEPLDEEVMQQAQMRMDNLTKPLGSLGRLERIAIHIAGIMRQVKPRVDGKAVVVMAGDHGVVQEGVSLYPQEVTVQMVHNFIRGGAAINVLSRHGDVRLIVVDIGVSADVEPSEGLLIRKVRYGTRNFTQDPAMTRPEALQAIAIGIDIAEQLINEGAQMLALGDMGIGNTTPSSAITAVLTGRLVEEVTGRGTGLDDAQW
ncbi:MAG TPA: nicotinate-nucleotide--dimethylbenzimidazole phosphoribosyltransferase, partial [Armatimonadetes bacterium]|nr:nicotinate-nucleotide--dimethylbenzimidazole phosphoribosyltransferase [Armatimonadota bacterium]